jgi:hypothetical protein
MELPEHLQQSLQLCPVSVGEPIVPWPGSLVSSWLLACCMVGWQQQEMLSSGCNGIAHWEQDNYAW